MESVAENVNLAEICMVRNNSIKFQFLNSYDGKADKMLECSHVLKCCIENETFENEEFPYFILDIYMKELSEDEIKSSLQYYRYGYGIDLSWLNKLYFISIIGSEICFEV